MQHGSAHDTLRWGDTETLTALEQLDAEAAGTTLSTKQLVAAHWRWPLAWNVQVVIDASGLVSGLGSTATIFVDVTFNVGVGQGVIQLVKEYAIVPVAGVYPSQVLDNFTLPAQDIQSVCSVSKGPGTFFGTGNAVQLSVLVAPMTEPHAMTAMLDEMARGGAPEPPRFMTGNEFHEEPVGYRGADGQLYPGYPPGFRG